MLILTATIAILSILIPGMVLALLLVSYVLTESWRKAIWLIWTSIKITWSKDAFIKEIQSFKIQQIQFDLKLIQYTDDIWVDMANPTTDSVKDIKQMAINLLQLEPSKLYSFEEANYYIHANPWAKYAINEIPKSKYQYLLKQLMQKEIIIEMANDSTTRASYLKTAIQKMMNLNYQIRNRKDDNDETL